MTTEIIMVRALERGLTLKDFEELTTGGILDYIITYNNVNSDPEEEKNNNIREAEQADFDRF